LRLSLLTSPILPSSPLGGGYSSAINTSKEREKKEGKEGLRENPIDPQLKRYWRSFPSMLAGAPHARDSQKIRKRGKRRKGVWEPAASRNPSPSTCHPLKEKGIPTTRPTNQTKKRKEKKGEEEREKGE